MKDIGCSYMEVSAKTGHNVKEFFRELAFVIAGEGKAKEKETGTGMRPTDKQSTAGQGPTTGAQQGGNINLNAQQHREANKDKKKSGCC